MDAIEANSVTLREITPADIPEIIAACNDPLVRRFLPMIPVPYTEEVARWYVTEYAPGRWAAGGAQYAIADRATGRLIGCVGIAPRDRGAGDLGYWLTPAARGRGAATHAVRAATTWAFANGYGRVQLRTALDNGPSQRVAIRSGYLREGVARAAGPARDGGRHDLVIWARLPGDPPGPAPRLIPDLPGGELSDGTVTLRPMVAADADDVYRTHLLPEVVAAQVPPEPYDRDRAARRCAYAESTWLAGVQAAMTVREAVTDAYAGEIGLFYQEPTTGQAMIGYQLDRPWRGRGYASRAVRLVAAWAFEQVGVARLIAGVRPDNEASQRVLVAAGFRREGYQRCRLPGPRGTRVDDLLFAALPGEVTAAPSVPSGAVLSPTRTRPR